MAEFLDQLAYPLNPSQTRCFLEDALAGGKSEAHIKQVVCTTGEDIDLPRFREAWQTVANRHAALGVAFRRDDRQEPYQRVWSPITVPISFEKRRESQATDKAVLIQKWLQEDRHNFF